ncbi:MAG: hypothetical protein F6K39_33110 [Okeania sp. SIO3B3]|nr:hypothetical protein [Okeania sp. SIO3B3]
MGKFYREASYVSSTQPTVWFCQGDRSYNRFSTTNILHCIIATYAIKESEHRNHSIEIDQKLNPFRELFQEVVVVG